MFTVVQQPAEVWADVEQQAHNMTRWADLAREIYTCCTVVGIVYLKNMYSGNDWITEIKLICAIDIKLAQKETTRTRFFMWKKSSVEKINFYSFTILYIFYAVETCWKDIVILHYSTLSIWIPDSYAKA